MLTTGLKIVIMATVLAATPSYSQDCKPLIEACDKALAAKDAQAEALKKAVESARKEADDCYKARKESSGGGWLVPLAIGIASGVLLGAAIGR